MIQKAAFYILNNDPSPKGRILYACRIIAKAYNNNHQIYVHTNSLDEAQNFDTQLWTFNDISFIPHEIYTPNSNLDIPILIGYGDNFPARTNNILVNFTHEIAPFYRQFGHIIEIIPNEENLKATARQRFQIYQKDGYTTEVFNV